MRKYSAHDAHRMFMAIRGSSLVVLNGWNSSEPQEGRV